jgi:hypothetical protein
MLQLFLLCAAIAWLALNVLAVAMCRLLARSNDAPLSMLATLCGGEDRNRRSRPSRLTSRPGRARRRAHCRCVATPAGFLRARRHRRA